MKPVVQKALSSMADILNTRPLALFSLTAIMFMALWLSENRPAVIVCGILVSVLLLALVLSGKITRPLFLFMALSVFLGSICAINAYEKNNSLETKLAGKTVFATGTVASVPKANRNEKRFYFDAKHIYYGEERYDNIKLYLICSGRNDIAFGERMDISTVLQKPLRYPYNMENVIHAKGASMMGFGTQVLRQRECGAFWSVVNGLRRQVRYSAEKIPGKDAKALFLGLTVGDKSFFREELTGDLAAAGISHIACVSGLHISLVGYVIFRLLKGLNRRGAMVVSVGAAFLFAAIAGLTPSAVRAAVMYALFMMSEMLAREKDSITSLTFSALILAAINPYVMYDLGFILSFLSVLGIILFMPVVNRFTFVLPQKMGEAVSATLSAQMLTAPVTLFCFGLHALYSVFANIVISFIFPFALLSAFLFIAVSALPVVSEIFAGICSFLLTCITAVASFFNSLPLAGLQTGRVDIYILICYFVLAAVLRFSKHISRPITSSVMILCAAVLVLSRSLPGGITTSKMNDDIMMIMSEKRSVLAIQGDAGDAAEFINENGGTVCDVLFLEEWRQTDDAEKMVRLTGAKDLYIPRSAGGVKLRDGDRVRVYSYPDEALKDDGLRDYIKTHLF